MKNFFRGQSWANIVQGNALRIDWKDIIAPERLNYIMGNPPFLGYSNQSKEQKADILSIYVNEKGKPFKTAGKMDYVTCWYYKASQYIQETDIRCAFVSTNSICQGEQVVSVWKPLYDMFNIHIDFAYKTFKWDSDSEGKAHVHCIIVGFSQAPNPSKRLIYDGDKVTECNEINFYLTQGKTTFVESRTKPLSSNAKKMTVGNRPADGGYLLLTEDDYKEFKDKEPRALQFIKRFVGAEEFINNKKRYCLWLVDVTPSQLRSMPMIIKRIELCKQARLGGAPDRQKLAETPHLMREQVNPDSFILVPRVSSERRLYIPMGFLNSDYISSDSSLIIPNATIYHFGVLTSSLHMAWMRVVAGRLKSDYRYSKDIVYNNFVWPEVSEAQKEKIEKTAQAILDARNLYPDSSLADLYDDLTMPIELRKAHQANDKAVLEAYALPASCSEEAMVEHLFKLYQETLCS